LTTARRSSGESLRLWSSTSRERPKRDNTKRLAKLLLVAVRKEGSLRTGPESYLLRPFF